MSQDAKISVEELPTTEQLFKKHFGDKCAVGLFHPNIENFFEELNLVCKKEDGLKLIGGEKLGVKVQQSEKQP